MKSDLQRIEAALQAVAQESAIALPPTPPDCAWDAAAINQDTLAIPLEALLVAASAPAPSLSVPSSSITSLPTLPMAQRPDLPAFAVASDPHPFMALTNSALASNLLKDLQTQVQTWATTLETVLQQIQVVYAEGPLVDGWLESFTDQPATSGYRLCGLGQDGQVWSRLCPPNQVPDISLAIARYQRLQSLLTEKHRLETQLGYLTESLVELHTNLANQIER
jgi:hypothetical protein